MRAATRLLVVTTSYPLRDGASAGVFVRRLVESFPEDLAVTVLSPDDSEPRPANSGALAGVHAFRYAPRRWQRLAQASGGVMPALRANPALGLLLPVLLLAMGLHTFRLALRSDIVLANWAACGAVVGFVGRLLGKPTVVTLRGDDVTQAERSRFQRLLLGCAVRWNQRVVCVAESMAVALRARYPESTAKIYTVLNGVGDEFLGLKSSPRNEDAPTILAIGSLIPRKGYDVLLDALARIAKRPFRVLIAGDGPDEQKLKQMTGEHGLEERVRFLGAVAPGQVPGLLQQADLFVLTSRGEGRSNVVLEAMAAGIAVVASRIPGTTDLLEDGVSGWLFPVDDAVALAGMLEEALADGKERVRRGTLARHHVLQSGWTWSAAGRSYARMFDELLARTPPSAEPR